MRAPTFQKKMSNMMSYGSILRCFQWDLSQDHKNRWRREITTDWPIWTKWRYHPLGPILRRLRQSGGTQCGTYLTGKGCAFGIFDNKESTSKAIERLNRKEVLGQTLQVNVASPMVLWCQRGNL